MEWNCLCPPELCFDDEHLYATCKEAPTRDFSDIDAFVSLFRGVCKACVWTRFFVRNAHFSPFSSRWNNAGAVQKDESLLAVFSVSVWHTPFSMSKHTPAFFFPFKAASMQHMVRSASTREADRSLRMSLLWNSCLGCNPLLPEGSWDRLQPLTSLFREKR